jgi:hypothetical protein
MNGSFDNFNRRPRSHSGSGFGPNSGFPPHTEMAFRPGRDNFNEFSEVGGPPNHPPPSSGFGRSMNMPNAPPPSSLSQSFPGPGSFPPPAGMGSSYGMGTREHDSFSGFDSSPGMHPTGFPHPSGPAYPNSFDGSPLSDNHFPPPMDDGGFSRGRSLSAGGGGFGGPPALLPPPGSMTPYSSHYPKRARRASSVGPGMGMGFGGGYAPEYHRPGGRVTVKFRLKGVSHSGISVNEALHRERLSQNHGYMMHDIAPDMLGRITLKVRVRCLTVAVALLPT